MRIIEKILAVVFAALAFFAAGHLLYSAYCAFTWGRFTLFDYGVYTNMIWNSGHGAPFKVLVHDSYLSTHLSFSLALIGPLFRIFDHPFLLSFLQWAMMVAGGWIIVVSGRRLNVPGVTIAALVFFFAGYRLTQGVLLSEFHTVGAYFLLVPWLYYCCRFSKHTAWLPLLLILGVREDAFIFIMPLLVYFAVKDKWRAGYILCGLAVAYGLVALFYIYPAINGMSLFDRRGKILGKIVAGAFDRRIHSCLWTILPIAVFIHWKSLPSLLFPAIAFLSVLASGYPVQQGMGSHYGAAVVICLAMGLLETAALRCRDGACRSGLPRIDMVLRSVLLVSVTLIFHLNNGFIYMGGKNNKIYNSISPDGQLALCAVKHLPQSGVLVTDHRLVGFCANRSDVLTWSRLKPDTGDYDVVFTESCLINDELWRAMQDGEWGVIYFDGEFIILGKGWNTSANRYVINRLQYGTILLGLTLKHGGETIMQGGMPVRYWCGRGVKAPITLSYGSRRFLQPGRYDAVFRYRTERPVKRYWGDWGRFSVHLLNDQKTPLAEAPVQRVVSPAGEYILQKVGFDVSCGTNIEVRVTGGDAKLWLDQVFFEKYADQ